MDTGINKDVCIKTKSMLFFWICLFLTSAVSGGFLWFEDVPDPNDPCTLVTYGTRKKDVVSLHPKPSCLKGGLLWLGTWGRLRTYYTLDGAQDFEICLTGGEANAIYLFYDYIGKFFEPIGFPMYMAIPPRHEMCKVSHNGSLTLMMDSPWAYPNYYSFVTWEITPLEREVARKMQKDYAYQKMKHKMPMFDVEEEEEEEEEDDDSWFEKKIQEKERREQNTTRF